MFPIKRTCSELCCILKKDGRGAKTDNQLVIIACLTSQHLPAVRCDARQRCEEAAQREILGSSGQSLAASVTCDVLQNCQPQLVRVPKEPLL